MWFFMKILRLCDKLVCDLKFVEVFYIDILIIVFLFLLLSILVKIEFYILYFVSII